MRTPSSNKLLVEDLIVFILYFLFLWTSIGLQVYLASDVTRTTMEIWSMIKKPSTDKPITCLSCVTNYANLEHDCPHKCVYCHLTDSGWISQMSTADIHGVGRFDVEVALKCLLREVSEGLVRFSGDSQMKPGAQG